MSEPRITACILAAGKGTRLTSERPKVMHEVCGRPMLSHVIDACRAAGVQQCVVVVGYEKAQITDALSSEDDLVFVEQAEQLGTGHAVMVCHEALAGKCDHVLVLCGDGPLIRPKTIRQLIDQHIANKAAATLATAEIDDPAGYGRIVRDGDGNLRGIVEHKDCSPDQRAIREVNPSYYCFRVEDLLESLTKIENDNAKGEYYVTDTLSVLVEAGRTVTAMTAVPPEDIFSINSRADLAMVNRVLRDRINGEMMESGVTIVDPQTTWIDARAQIGPDTVVHPFTCISGKVLIGRACTIGPFAHVREGTVLGDNVAFSAMAGA